MRRCALVLATALLSVTALAGCGSADDEAADDTDTTTSSATEDESPDTEDTDDTDDTDDTGDADDKSGSDKQDKPEKKDKSGGSDDAGDADDSKKKADDDSGETTQAKADYCDLVKKLQADFDPSNSASLAASRDLDAIADRLDDITGEAPGNVRPSWQRLSATFQSFADQLEKYDIDLSDPNAFNKLKPKERKALSKSAQQYQSPQVSKATSTIAKDAKRRCNVTLG